MTSDISSEEGTFTPKFTRQSGAVVDSSSGSYRKIRNIIHFWITGNTKTGIALDDEWELPASCLPYSGTTGSYGGASSAGNDGGRRTWAIGSYGSTAFLVKTIEYSGSNTTTFFAWSGYYIQS